MGILRSLYNGEEDEKISDNRVVSPFYKKSCKGGRNLC